MKNPLYYSFNCFDKSCNGEIILCDNYYYVCTSCGTVQKYNYYVPEKFDDLIIKPPYKCITYFRRILKCMQNKTNSTIPNFIIDLLNDKRNRKLTPREILKKNKLFQFYILLPIIEETYYNKKPKQLNDHEEILLCKYFQRIEKKVRKMYPNRKQILRYKPILKKLLYMIGRDDIANTLPDLKSEKARIQFETIWNTLNFFI